ncbi:uncharacterized protein LOC121380030 isoform X2 [Gigantopelta aegis]|uniref:uncharacterized protein LOC121380030 isoform X2 n=1 Tax=Gigantopelta aegis TaxID=1735272 RepID=UPI001B888840|nr:uncharacterized protein LOC121380030 isoform X2 [Gigantopelta aegis]
MKDDAYFFGKGAKIFDRNLQQVAFKVDPLNQRDSVDEQEAEEYHPTSSFLPVYPSIVLCEDLNSNDEPAKVELSPDSFWEYLYSSSWDEECVIRVLDGKLLTLICQALNILHRDKVIVSHSSFALAKNRRAKDGSIDEIVLMDLTYYAKRTYHSGMDYPFKHTTSKILLDTVSDPINYEEYSMEIQKRLKTYVKKGDGMAPLPIRSPRSIKCGFSKVETVDTGLLGMTGPITTVPLSYLQTLMNSHSPKRSKFFNKKHHAQIRKDRSKSPFVEAMPKECVRKTPQLDINLGIILESNTQMTSEKLPESLSTKYQEEAASLELSFGEKKFWKWNLEDICCRRKPPGSHYYINQEKLVNDEFPETAEKYLQNNKQQRLLKRQTKKNEQEEKIDRTMDIPSETKISLPKIYSGQPESIIGSMNAIPSFTVFAKWLDNCEKMKKRERRQYNRRDKRKKDGQPSLSIQMNLNFKSWKENKYAKLTGLPLPLSTGMTNETLSADNSTSSSLSPSASDVLDDSLTPTRTPDILSPQDSATSSNSAELDDESSEGSENLPFHCKINKNFSREVFINKTIESKDPILFNALKKTFGIHRAIVIYKACRRKRRPPVRLVKSIPKMRFNKTRASLEETVMSEAPEMVLGKIKPFKFLEYRNYKSKNPRVTLPDFALVNHLEDFKLRLQRAVDDFVIRKENFTTDYGYKYVPSVTFTRPSVFRKFRLA